MAFDECAPGKSNKEYARKAMERTHRWAVRCVKRWKENNEKRTVTPSSILIRHQSMQNFLSFFQPNFAMKEVLD